MKLFLGRNRQRQLLIGSACIICGILVCWAQMAVPLLEKKAALHEELEKLTIERGRLAEKLNKVVEFNETHKTAESELARYDAQKVEGKTIEALSASTQSILQQFLEKKTIPIKAYKDLPASKWREHPISRIELQIETGMQGISDLLEYLETLNKVIRVERLTISYRRQKNSDLQISLQIATLQMEGINP